jgi:hypothetical protein
MGLLGDLLAMRFEEYRKHDAVSLAGLIAKRQVSAKEVLETAIARAEQVNPAINAIVHKQYEQACRAVAAGLPEGPLKGVPYLIKDLGFFETGEPETATDLARGTESLQTLSAGGKWIRTSSSAPNRQRLASPEMSPI